MKKHHLYIKISTISLALGFLCCAVAGQSMAAEVVGTKNTKQLKKVEPRPGTNSKPTISTSKDKIGNQNAAKNPAPKKSSKAVKSGDSIAVVEAKLGPPNSMQYRQYDGTQVYYYSKAHVVFKNGAALRVGSNAAEKARLASVARTYPSSTRKTTRTRSIVKTSSNRRVTTAQSRTVADEKLKAMLMLAEQSRARRESQPTIIPFPRPYNYSYGNISPQGGSALWKDNFTSINTSTRSYSYPYENSLSHGRSALWDDTPISNYTSPRSYDYSYGNTSSYGSSYLWDDNVGIGKQNSEYKYESMLGTKYKYDLSDPLDLIEYKTDIFAQQDDRINPMIRLDRNLGQYGGGAEW